MEGGSEGIEEGSRLASSEARWVDGSEVDSESPPLLYMELEGGFGGSWEVGESSIGEKGSLRRRLLKKPQRVDSFDVEAMDIANAHKHHLKVR